MKGIKAINDFLVIKVIRDTHDIGGLIVDSKNNQIRYNYGEVITASPNVVLEEGDKVYYDSVSGSELIHNQEKFLVIRERDVAIIDGED